MPHTQGGAWLTLSCRVTAPWVFNPVVQRFGLVYDITEFSATISLV